MAFVQYKTVNFRAEARQRIDLCNTIIEQYQARGLRMTLRQLYYRLVARNAIRNEERSYKNLSNMISEARLAGLVDWDAIEDRARQPRVNSEWNDPAQLVRGALRAYRLPRWKDQEGAVELWVEKDALSSVLAPIADRFHVTLMVNRGYSSQSAMYESATRLMESHAATLSYREPTVLYIGDHDPSGEDMVRDVRERLTMFAGAEVTVRKIALTREQVDEYDPPPNPAKITDPRAAAYIAEHGDSSWEADALPPETLTEIVEAAIEELLDRPAYEAICQLEEQDKQRLIKATASIMKKRGA